MITKGPRLNDYDFFTKVIDTSIEELEPINELVKSSDFTNAKKIFADYIRKSLKPDKFFKIPYKFGGNVFTYPDESEEEAAERILRLELISTGTPCKFVDKVDWFANPTFNKYKEWTWQLSRHHEFKLLAHHYIETADERYAKCFVELFESWVEQAIIPENASGSDTLCWRTIEAGIRAGSTWPYTLHAFYKSPSFTDDVLIDWYKSAWEHGWRLRNFHRTGNWLIMEMNGLAHTSILYPVFRDSASWKQYALEKLTEELKLQIYPDCFQYELSTGYHNVVIKNYLQVINICNAYGENIPADFITYMEKAYELYIKLVMPDGRLPDINDGSWAGIKELMKESIVLFPYREDFLWACTGSLKGKPPVNASCFLPYSGMAVMRSGWEKDAIWALFDAGPFGRGHQHEDKLNLLVHAYGRLLLTEGGNYAYDDSEMRKYVLSTRSHNTIRVDGMDQNRRSHYRWQDNDIEKLSDANYHTSEKYDYADGVYDEGYGPGAELKVKHFRRVIFLKDEAFGFNPCFVVIDRLYPQDGRKHEYEILWHPECENVEIRNARIFAGETGEPGLTFVTSSLKSMKVDIVRGQESPEWQGWKTFDRALQGQYTPSPTIVFKTASSEPLRVITVLYPSRDCTCPIASIEASSEVENDGIKILLENGENVLINEKNF